MVLSSPEYPQGHALIERHIQTIKKCMSKCDISNYDFDLALLVLRSTPLGTDLPSPAELLQQRRFRTTLPVYVANPPNAKEVKEKIQEKQKIAAERYNRTAKSKPDLIEGQPVRLYCKNSRTWEPAVVTGQAATPRSYTVQRLAGGVPLRRNRVHLRTTRESFPEGPYQESDGEEEEEEVMSTTSNNAGDNSPGMGTVVDTVPPPATSNLRRSNRIKKQTEFFQSG